MDRRVGVALAAAIGGALWTVKAGAILAGAPQPGGAFELAPLAFAVAVALLASEPAPGSRARTVARSLAVVAVAATAVSAAGYLATGEIVGPAMMLGVLATLGSLGVTGHRIRAQRSVPGPARWLPFLIAVGTVPATLVGGALSTIDERLLELPILSIGVAWLALGASLAGVRPGAVPPRGARRGRSPAR